MAVEEGGNRSGDGEVEKKKKRKRVYVYGNYKGYYGYRIGQNGSEDPRLSVFKKEWFEGKDCLDIGCNQGIVTISIAKFFSCRSILGIDIDGSLIENACWNLRKIAKEELVNSKKEIVSEPQPSNSITCSDGNACESEKDVAKLQNKSSCLNGVNLSDRVSFRRDNIVESWQDCSAMYHTILCLSVTKWIHLNWGDDGLIKLFAKIWRLLHPGSVGADVQASKQLLLKFKLIIMGGILILEPQPWESYKKNYLVSETTRLNYYNISLTPDSFRDVLMDKIGFRSVESPCGSLEGSSTGFDRPIFIFHK